MDYSAFLNSIDVSLRASVKEQLLDAYNSRPYISGSASTDEECEEIMYKRINAEERKKLLSVLQLHKKCEDLNQELTARLGLCCKSNREASDIVLEIDKIKKDLETYQCGATLASRMIHDLVRKTRYIYLPVQRKFSCGPPVMGLQVCFKTPDPSRPPCRCYGTCGHRNLIGEDKSLEMSDYMLKKDLIDHIFLCKDCTNPKTVKHWKEFLLMMLKRRNSGPSTDGVNYYYNTFTIEKGDEFDSEICSDTDMSSLGSSSSWSSDDDSDDGDDDATPTPVASSSRCSIM